MGIIQRQAFKQSLVSYFAAAIAFISTIWIYPLNQEAYGLAQWMFNTSVLLLPLTSVGVISLAVKFFPEFQNDDNQHNGLLLNLLILATAIFGISTGLLVWFRTPILHVLESIGFDTETINTYAVRIFVFTLIVLYVRIFTQYIANYKRIVIPALFNNLWIKIALPLIILGYFFGHLDLQMVVDLWIASYLINLFALITYAHVLGALDLRPNFAFLTRDLAKRMASYSIYGALSEIGTKLTLRVDVFMIGLILNMEKTGIYSIAAFIANVIEIPTRAIWNIAGPVISQAFGRNDMEEIEMIYKKSSVNLVLVGTLIYVLISTSIDDLFRFTSEYTSMTAGVSVVLILGLAKVIDMLTSVNHYIIIYSKYYRWNLYFLLTLGAINCALNFVFLNMYGIPGAAIATMTSLALYNAMKMAFIWTKFKIHPFTNKTLIILIIGLMAFGLGHFIPSVSSPVLSIALRSIAIMLLYLPLNYFLHTSPDMEGFLKGVLRKVRQALSAIF